MMIYENEILINPNVLGIVQVAIGRSHVTAMLSLYVMENVQDGRVYGSAPELGAELGFSRQAINRAIRDLENAGLVARFYEGGKRGLLVNPDFIFSIPDKRI